MTDQRLPYVDGDDGSWGDILNQFLSKEHYNSGSDDAANGGHQNITIRPGTTSNAPITFSSGTNLTTPVAGAMEYDGSYYYLTTSGGTRRKIAIYDDASGATGDLYYRDSGGAFKRLGIGSSGNVLAVSGGLPSWQPAPSSLPVTDDTAVVKNTTDTTKQLKFDLSDISTTGTTRTLTVPDADTTIVGTDAMQTLTNKTISGVDNTLTDIPQEQLVATNLLTTNPSFASDISGWSQDGSNSWTWDGTVGHTSNGSAKIVADGSSRYFASDSVSVTPGATYILGAWVKTSSVVAGGGEVDVGINTFDSGSYVNFVEPTGKLANTPAGNWRAIYQDGSFDWIFIGGQYTVPDSGVNQIGLSFNSNVASGTVWLDDAIIALATIDQTWVKGLGYAIDAIADNAQYGTQTLQNKTLDNSNTATLKDTNFTLQDDGSTSKQLQFQLSGLTTTRTLTVPDADTTIVGTNASQVLTNKDLASGTNTFPTFNQNTTGSAAKLTTPRTVQTNLSSTSSVSFDGSTNITPGVTGTLSVGNGGTGATTLTGVVVGNGTSAFTSVTAPSGNIVGTTDAQTLTNKTLTSPTVNGYTEGVTSIGTVTSSYTLSISSGTVLTATLTASTACTFTMPTAVAGQSFILLLKQAASTGAGTATFTSVKWNGSGAPTITATAGKMDILSFVSDGTSWYGSYTQGYTP